MLFEIEPTTRRVLDGASAKTSIIERELRQARDVSTGQPGPQIVPTRATRVWSFRLVAAMTSETR